MLERNVDFLKKVLAARWITDALTPAVEWLADHPEYGVAKGIRDDLPLCIETLQARCAELPLLLATSQKCACCFRVIWTCKAGNRIHLRIARVAAGHHRC